VPEKHQYQTKMPVLNFKNPSAELPEIQGGGLRLMLWAGDVVHDGVSDIQRLPGYDVYLCYGFTGGSGLEDNINYLNSMPNGNHFYLCLIDVHDQDQMDRFVDHFKGKFSVIDSDYHGNTPSIPLQVYSDLLVSGGTAYHLEGLNSLRMPTEEYLDLLELFAPVLNLESASRRLWTQELIQEAKDNRLTPAETWSSPDLKHSYYDGLRYRQEHFMKEQRKRSPLFSLIWNYDATNLEDYWGRLPLDILTAPIQNLPAELAYLNQYLPRLYEFLLTWVRCESPGLDEGHNDYMIYIESVEPIAARVSRCQHVLNKRSYCAAIVVKPLLLPTLKYFIDTRYTGSPRREYGVTISKV
jgi:hypothetical protein